MRIEHDHTSRSADDGHRNARGDAYCDCLNHRQPDETFTRTVIFSTGIGETRSSAIHGKEEKPDYEARMARALHRGIVSKRPWGRFTTYVVNGNGLTVKVIVVNPGQRLSLQYHSRRSERWVCLEGEAIVQINGRKRVLRPFQEAIVPVGARHRLGAGALGAKVLEIAEGLFSEGDIVRLEDDYHRV